MDRYGWGRHHRSAQDEGLTSLDVVARVELSSRLAIACHIKSRSALDCTLGITDLIELPEEVDLLVPAGVGMFERYRIRIAWRKGSRLKGLFIGPGRIERS